jgi:16S rRNA G966 N2-methylase RsmD
MSFDFAVLGEILEHVNDPVCFLKRIKNNLQNICTKIIITVPNALRFRRVSDKLKGANLTHVEAINSDHRYWFTPYTIAKVCVEAGVYPEELLFCDPPYISNLLKRRLRLKDVLHASCLSDTLLIIGSMNKGEPSLQF